jgi:rod shape-determining protein MreD
MIMPRGQQLLLPASSFFIAMSLFVALLFNMIENVGLLGNAAWMPDFVALVLLFWSVHQPQRVSIGWAFFLGLACDVHQVSFLGQHALAYVVLGFFATLIHRRLLWFSVPSQALQVLPLFAISHAISMLIRMSLSGSLMGWSMVFAPLLEAMMWPLMSIILLAPQRRAPDPDENRPL